MGASGIAIQTADLTKSFGGVAAVDCLNLTISQGEVFGFLGPNGAGKTTTIRLLAGILAPTSGEAKVLGFDVVRESEDVKKRIGYVAQAFGLYGDLTVEENLEFYAWLYNHSDKSRFNELIRAYGFEEHRRKLARELSGGYKTRLALITALAHRPSLLFLDEPTAGVDPVTRKELWDMFYALKGQGTTLFVTTHYMEEAERCDRLAFIYRGKLIALGAPREMKNLLADRDVFEIRTAFRPDVLQAVKGCPGVETFNQFGNALKVVLRKSRENGDALARALKPCGLEPSCITAAEPTMEDVFVALTHRGGGTQSLT